MPSRVDPRSGPFPVYSSASPPTTDVGIFGVVKTAVDLKNAATTNVFTVPTGRVFIALWYSVLVTSVTSGGAGQFVMVLKESSAARAMIIAATHTSTTPVANQTVYIKFAATDSGAAMSSCTAGNIVQAVISASNAGSTAVSGPFTVFGYYQV